MATTKRFLMLSKEQQQTAQDWFPFVNNIVDIDINIYNKMNAKEDMGISESQALVLFKWWSYIPQPIVDNSDKELYEALKGFLFD